MDEVGKILYLINYDRSKTLYEQSNNSRRTITVTPNGKGELEAPDLPGEKNNNIKSASPPKSKIVTDYDKTYDYKKEFGKYYTKKKGTKNWTEVTDEKQIWEIKNKVFNDPPLVGDFAFMTNREFLQFNEKYPELASKAIEKSKELEAEKIKKRQTLFLSVFPEDKSYSDRFEKPIPFPNWDDYPGITAKEKREMVMKIDLENWDIFMRNLEKQKPSCFNSFKKEMKNKLENNEINQEQYQYGTEDDFQFNSFWNEWLDNVKFEYTDTLSSTLPGPTQQNDWVHYRPSTEDEIDESMDASTMSICNYVIWRINNKPRTREEVEKDLKVYRYEKSQTVWPQDTTDPIKRGFQPEILPNPSSIGIPCGEDAEERLGCINSYYVCPPDSDQYNREDYCFYGSVEVDEWQPKPIIFAVHPDDKVEFWDPETLPQLLEEYRVDAYKYRSMTNCYKNLRGVTVYKDGNDVCTLDQVKISGYGSKISQYPDAVKIGWAWFIANVRGLMMEKFKTGDYTQYMIRYIAPPGSIKSITKKNGKKYTQRFKFEKYNYVGHDLDTNRSVTSYVLINQGLLSASGEEYESPRASDLRTGWDKFVDTFGVGIQIGVAIIGAIGTIWTGGASGAVTASIVADLVVGGIVAQREWEKGNYGLALIEVIFGLIPLLNFTESFAGISREALESLGKKLAQNADTLKGNNKRQMVEFWESLTEGERKALAVLSRQEKHFISKMSKQLAVKDMSVEFLERLIKSVDEAAGKDLVLKFWRSASGRELKLNGLFMVLGFWLYQHSNTKKLDEELQKSLMNLYTIGERQGGYGDQAVETVVTYIMDNKDDPNTQKNVSREIDNYLDSHKQVNSADFYEMF